LTPDPIGLDGGANIYVYTANNPLLIIDPLGLQGFNPGPNPEDPSSYRDPRTPWLPPNLQNRNEDCPPYYRAKLNGFFSSASQYGLIPLVKVEETPL